MFSPLLGVALVSISDWNNAENGVFYGTSASLNKPVSATITGIQLENQSGHKVQLGFRAVNGELYYRGYSNNQWTPWYKVGVSVV